MCGIIAITGDQPTAARLLDGLRRLEYRGYDSAGLAVINGDGGLVRRRAPGKISALQGALDAAPIDGAAGIAHTRWATHGAATEVNAHPHQTTRVSVVHNGIIENFRVLRDELTAAGHAFESDTDSEVIAHLVENALASGASPFDAVLRAVGRLEGAFALAILIAGATPALYGARHGSPLVVGHGEGEMYLGSDALALGPLTRRVQYLEDGDIVAVTPDKADVFDRAGLPAARAVKTVSASAALVEKGEHRHFMEKEIHEQPEALARTLAAYVDPVGETVRGPEGLDFTSVDRLLLTACGTAAYAGLVARYWFEPMAGLVTEVDLASELRYRGPALSPSTLAMAISQSGETADTRAALELAKAAGLPTAGVVNVPESTIARLVDTVAPTHAGPEIGVASTKAFTCQLAVLAALAVAAGRARGRMDADAEAGFVRALMETPRLIGDALETEAAILPLAQEFAKARDVLYLGRGAYYPMALEAALKLKEISYIHAEGYAAGELKHGPIALIDETTPTVVVAPHDALFEKTASSIQEVMARGGPVTLITDPDGAEAAPEGVTLIVGPRAPALVAPIVYAAPIQLLAYHVAVQKGTDVDQPRNLAKSVTVE